MERLRVSDPVRHAQFMDHLGKLRHGQQVLQQVQAERQQTAKSEFDQRAVENDRFWESLHADELKDPARHQLRERRRRWSMLV